MGGLYFFEISGVARQDAFVDAFGEGLGEGFGGVLSDFGWILGVGRESSFEVEVETRKSGSRDTKGCSGHGWHIGLAALIVMNDQSIAGIIDC